MTAPDWTNSVVQSGALSYTVPNERFQLQSDFGDMMSPEITIEYGLSTLA